MADPTFTFLPLGAILQSFTINNINIVQGFPTLALYEKHNEEADVHGTPFFGETIGRVANRIAGGKIEGLNGRGYELSRNNGENALHGGIKGWGKRVWEGPVAVGRREIPGVEGLEGGESVEFRLRSEDGDEGYPGTVDVSVIYTSGMQEVGEKEIKVLGIEYEVKLVGEEVDETVVNVTNHSYFNLAGAATIEGTEVTLVSNSFLPVDAGGIPTGGPTAYSSITPGKSFILGPVEPDIDDCFVVDNAPTLLDTRSSKLTKIVEAYHPLTQIHLEVLSTEPAFQLYTGKYIDVPEAAGVPARGARSGFCVEPSRFVNAVNVPEWRAQVVLKKGEVYGSRIVYRGWSDERRV